MNINNLVIKTSGEFVTWVVTAYRFLLYCLILYCYILYLCNFVLYLDALSIM